MEFLDVYDENNQPTGRHELRSVVHQEGLWHRVVHIYLYKKINGQLFFLVHLRSNNVASCPNMWATRFGGHVKAGESLEEATRNELMEEINLCLAGLRLIEGEWRKTDIFPNREFSKPYYLEFIGQERDLIFNDGEVEKVKWMRADEIEESIRNHQDEWAASLGGFQTVLKALE